MRLIRDSDPNPYDQAMELVYDAFDASEPRQQEKLARKALELSKDVADAWVILADLSESPREARDLCIEGVAAAERVLGGELAELKRERVLWLAIEARPWMRARLGLACATWDMGDRPRAIDQAWELLDMNPNDNQGIRYILFDWLMRAGSLEQIERLIGAYPEERSARWMYSLALHAYRSDGPTPRVNASLHAATQGNKHVVEILMGQRMMPTEPPAFVGFGDVNEAADYLANSLSLWLETPGALLWLARESDKARKTGNAGRGTAKAGRKKRR